MASPAYWAYRFQLIGQEAQQALVQSLAEAMPFNGFEETLDEVVAYVDAGLVDDQFQADLNNLIAAEGLTFERQFIPGQNWNAQWEAAFQPVRVGSFVGVRAEFHPPFDGVQFDLMIHPRMAFGTGHHATTYLMMERMEQLDMTTGKVFDYGCGTGILAILAKKLGAVEIDAVDIELAATENTLVNMQANDVDGIDIYTGTLDVVPPTTYQIILANINRNVILASLEALYQRIEKGGDLLVSGILLKDQQKVEETAASHGWQLLDSRSKDGWLMFHFKRP